MKEIWTKDEAEFHGQHVKLRQDLVLAQARAEAAPARAPGRRERPHAPARGRLLRRLVPARPRRRGHPAGAQGPGRARRQGRARHEDHLDVHLRREAGRGDARDLRAGRHHAGHPAAAARGPGHGAPAPRPVGEAHQEVARRKRSVGLDGGSWRWRARPGELEDVHAGVGAIHDVDVSAIVDFRRCWSGSRPCTASVPPAFTQRLSVLGVTAGM